MYILNIYNLSINYNCLHHTFDKDLLGKEKFGSRNIHHMYINHV